MFQPEATPLAGGAWEAAPPWLHRPKASLSVVENQHSHPSLAVLGYHLSIVRLPMLTPRTVVLLRLLRSGWSVACLALLLATLVEWGLIAEF